MKHIDTSPIDDSELTPYLSSIDYTVSKKPFKILRDSTNGLLVTSPRPADEGLADYYDSDGYISHTDAKKTILDRVYQFVRSYSLKKKLSLINSFSVDERLVLDIGAGTGDFLKVCKNNGWKTHGVEPSDKARNIAEQKLNKQLAIRISDHKSKQFDVITMWHVLEHVPNLNSTISELKRLFETKRNINCCCAKP